MPMSTADTAVPTAAGAAAVGAAAAARRKDSHAPQGRLQEVVGYLTGVPAWFLATSVEGEPHVRPFSFAAAEDGKLWLSTSKGKDVYDELLENPRFELSAWAPGKPWLIVHGTAVFAEPSAALRQRGFEHMTALGEEHRDANDGLLVFFYVDEALVRVCDIDGYEERFNL
jgi:uncharacterized pyridoxamine 5'-phosphate oxidase family protein